MSLEVTGKLESVLPEVTGTGRNGAWVKQSFVIQTEGQYPKQVCFDAWGDKADVVKNMNAGEMVKVSFEPESREFNGKWYTNLRAWRIEAVTGSAQTPPPPPPPADAAPSGDSSAPQVEDDLPF